MTYASAPARQRRVPRKVHEGPRCSLIQVCSWSSARRVSLATKSAILPPINGTLHSTVTSVVFVTSGVSVQGRAYWGAYAASKFALEGLTQVLADETDTVTNIRSNSVNPGRMRTPMRAANRTAGKKCTKSFWPAL